MAQANLIAESLVRFISKNHPFIEIDTEEVAAHLLGDPTLMNEVRRMNASKILEPDEETTIDEQIQLIECADHDDESSIEFVDGVFVRDQWQDFYTVNSFLAEINEIDLP